jgi:hypothetical protein
MCAVQQTIAKRYHQYLYTFATFLFRFPAASGLMLVGGF